jgi:CRP-like cAMP-binding protein
MTTPGSPAVDPEPLVRALLADHCFTRTLPEEYRARVARHARLQTFDDGVLLFREGEPADSFHLVVRGRVSLQMHVPGRGSVVVDTVEQCDTAGWSWLVPPYRWFFDARAVGEVLVVTVEATELRRLCEDDPAFGYLLLQQVSAVMLHRLQAARVRLADLYGLAP